MADPTRLPEIIVPPKGHLGPAMQAITPKQRVFVLAYCRFGAHHGVGARAAKCVNPEMTDGSAKVSAYKWLHMPKVRKAISEEVAKLKDVLTDRAWTRASELLESDDEGIAIKTVDLVLKARGEFAPQQVKHSHVHEIGELTLEELNKRIDEAEKKAIAEREMKRLNAPVDIVEGSFVEVDAPTESATVVAGDSIGADNDSGGTPVGAAIG